MVQTIIIGILIIASLAYLGRMLMRSFKGQAHCETGCNKCAVSEKTFEAALKK